MNTKVKILFKFKVENNIFEIFGDFSETKDMENIFQPTVSKIAQNGKEISDFGVSWYGHIFSKKDTFRSTLISYLNDNQTLDFLEVHTEIKSYKDKYFSAYNSETGSKVPKVIITSLKEKCNLIAISKDRNYYFNEEDELYIVTDKNNVIQTDIDAFFLSTFVDDYEKGNFLFSNVVAKAMSKEYT